MVSHYLDPLSEEIIRTVRNSNFWIHLNGQRGNCVSISPKLALCALHKKFGIGTLITVTTNRGQKLAATIVFSRFKHEAVDIAVLMLDSPHKFDDFITVHGKPMQELEKMYVFGMKLENNETPQDFSAECQVNTVRKKGAIIEADYPGHRGLSGAPVVTVVENNALRVVGVHVGTHGESAVIDKGSTENQSQFASRKDVHDALSTFSHDNHALSSYAMICDVARVKDLMKFLSVGKGKQPAVIEAAVRVAGGKRKRESAAAAGGAKKAKAVGKKK